MPGQPRLAATPNRTVRTNKTEDLVPDCWHARPVVGKRPCWPVEIEAGPVERRYGGQAKDRPPGSRGLSAIAFAEKLADGGALMEGAAVLDGHVGRVHDHSRLCLACERGCYWPGQQ